MTATLVCCNFGEKALLVTAYCCVGFLRGSKSVSDSRGRGGKKATNCMLKVIIYDKYTVCNLYGPKIKHTGDY